MNIDELDSQIAELDRQIAEEEARLNATMQGMDSSTPTEKPVEEMSLDELDAEIARLEGRNASAPAYSPQIETPPPVQSAVQEPTPPQRLLMGEVVANAGEMPTADDFKGAEAMGGATEGALRAQERYGTIAAPDDGSVGNWAANAFTTFSQGSTGRIASTDIASKTAQVAEGFKEGEGGRKIPFTQLSDDELDDYMNSVAPNGFFSYIGNAVGLGGRNKLMKEWDETQGVKFTDPVAKKNARVRYAMDVARNILGVDAQLKGSAKAELEGRDKQWQSRLVSGGLDMLGYMSPYLASFVGGPWVGMAASAAAEGTARRNELLGPRFVTDENGNVRYAGEGDTRNAALVKGAVRGAGSALIERFTGNVAGKLAGATLGRFPILQKVGDAVVDSAVGKKLASYTKGFNKLFGSIGLNTLPVEVGEELVDQIFDAGLGLDQTESEKQGTTAWSRTKDSVAQFMKPENLLDLVESMALVQILGGGAATYGQWRSSRNADALLERVAGVDKSKLKDFTAEEKWAAYEAYVNGLSEKEVQEKLGRGAKAVNALADTIRKDAAWLEDFRNSAMAMYDNAGERRRYAAENDRMAATEEAQRREAGEDFYQGSAIRRNIDRLNRADELRQQEPEQRARNDEQERYNAQMLAREMGRQPDSEAMMLAEQEKYPRISPIHTTQQETTDETRNGSNEAPAQPEQAQSVAPPAGEETVTVPQGAQGAEADGVVTPPVEPVAETPAEAPTSASMEDSAKRRYTKEPLVFKEPYVGKTGAKLTSYLWENKPEEYIDMRGEERTRRISDWDNAEENPFTRREIVHQFTVETTDGNVHVVSAETAAKLLGVSQSTIRTKGSKAVEQAIKQARMRKIEAKAQKRDADNLTWLNQRITKAALDAYSKLADRGKLQNAEYPNGSVAVDEDGTIRAWARGSSRLLYKIHPDGSVEESKTETQINSRSISNQTLAKATPASASSVAAPSAEGAITQPTTTESAEGQISPSDGTITPEQATAERKKGKRIPKSKGKTAEKSDSVAPTTDTTSEAESVRDSMRNDTELQRLDAAYKAAKTDEERADIQAKFQKRVNELRDGKAQSARPVASVPADAELGFSPIAETPAKKSGDSPSVADNKPNTTKKPQETTVERTEATGRENTRPNAETRPEAVSGANAGRSGGAVRKVNPAAPNFKRGERVFLKGTTSKQTVTFLKANADGTVDVQVRTPGANRYAPTTAETRTVPAADVSATRLKDTLSVSEKEALKRGMEGEFDEQWINGQKGALTERGRKILDYVNSIVGKTFERKGADGSRTVEKVLRITPKGNVRLLQNIWEADGTQSVKDREYTQFASQARYNQDGWQEVEDKVSFMSDEFSPNARREYDEVYNHYHNTDGTAKPGWMKAPNGKPSNLTERQWVQVRTPSFKKWFGDWELLSIKQGWIDVRDPEEIKNLQAQDISAFQPIKDKSELVDLFKRFGEVKNASDGRIVRFPSKSAGKMIFKKNHASAFKMLFEGSLQAFVEDEIKYDGHKEHPNVKAYRQYINKFTDGNGTYYIRFTVRDDSNGSLVHGAEISDIEIYNENGATQFGNQTDGKPHSNNGNKPFIDNKIAYYLSAVNPSSVSKVVDENGEPMVVYHATDDSFTEFKREKLGAFTEANGGNVDLAKVGFWFNNNDLSKKLFTKNSIPVFLNIKNPSTTSFEDMYDGFRDEAADGYIVDDSELGGTSYVALDSTQIKSATDNTGAFDGANPDIRYFRATVADRLQDPNFLEDMAKIGKAPTVANWDWWQTKKVKALENVWRNFIKGVKVVYAKETPQNVGEGNRQSIGGIYTGSAADYEKPSLHYVGSGEGSQVYGWGLYGSNVRGVAERYANPSGKLSDVLVNGKRHKAVGVYADVADFLKSGDTENFIKDTTSALDEMQHALDDSGKTSIQYGFWRIDQRYIDNRRANLEEAQRIINDGATLARPGNLYEQTFFTDRVLGDESHLLKWYEPVSEEQTEWIFTSMLPGHGNEFNKAIADYIASWRSKIKAAEKDPNAKKDLVYRVEQERGEDLYRVVEEALGSPKAASEFLARAGIDGVKYPVDSYGGKGVKDGDEVGWNYVSFRDDNIRVDHKWVDGELRYLHDRSSGQTLGTWNPKTNTVTLYPGATMETVAHELGGHALWQYATEHPELGLKRKLESWADDAPPMLADAVRRAYPELTGERLLEEIFANRFGMEKGSVLERELNTREGRAWYGKIWDAIKDAWKRMMTNLGYNRLDIEAIDGMTPDEAVEHIAVQMSRGKTLGSLSGNGGMQNSAATDATANLNGISGQDIADILDGRDGTMRRIRAWLQDHAILLRDMEDARGVRKEDSTYYAMDRAFGLKQADIDDFERRYVNRIADILAKGGVSAGQLDGFLKAMHAKERNATILEREGRANGSGMSDTEADALLGTYRRMGIYDKLMEAGEVVWEMNREYLQKRVDSGRISQEYADLLNRQWKYYVPLRTDMENDELGVYNPSTGGWGSREFKTARGRSTDADSPLQWSISQNTQAIRAARDNEVRQKFATFVRSNPQLGEVLDGLRVGDGLTTTWDFTAGEPGLVVDANFNEDKRRDLVFFKENGELKAIKLNPGEHGRGYRLADILTGRDIRKFNETFAWIPGITRLMSMMRTQMVPTFILRNFKADTLGTLLTVAGERGWMDSGRFIKRMVVNEKRNLKDVVAYFRDGERRGYMKEFVENGGLTGGGLVAEGYTEAGDDFARALKIANGGKAQTALRKVMGGISLANSVAEYSTRLGVYRTLREEGMDVADAISYARDITTNFNRKGAFSPYVNAAYMFSNATIQSTARIAKSLKGEHGIEVLAGLALIGFAQAVLDHFLGDDEEREKKGLSNASNLSEYEKQMSIGIPLPGGTRFKWQIRNPLAIVSYLGRKMGEVAVGGRNADEAAKEFAEALGGLVTDPVGGNGLESADAILQTVAPTMLDPVVQWATGKDYKGDDRLRKSFSKSAPSSWNGKFGTPNFYKAIAKALNAISGGGEFRKGFLDVAPENVKLFVETLFGGVATDVGRVATTGQNLVSAAMGNAPEQLLRDMPFLRDTITNTPDVNARYYQAVERYEADKYEFRNAKTYKERKELRKGKPYLTMEKGYVDRLIDNVKTLSKREQGKAKSASGKWIDANFSERQKADARSRRLKLQAKILKILKGDSLAVQDAKPDQVLRDVPFVRDTITNMPDVSRRFYEALDDYEADIKEYRGIADLKERLAFFKSHPWVDRGDFKELVRRIKNNQKREQGFEKVGQKWMPRKRKPAEALAYRRWRLADEAKFVALKEESARKAANGK